MLDTHIRQSNSIAFNSVSGILVKSHEDSRFIRCHMNSKIAGAIFDTERPNIDRKQVRVLQVMLCGGDNFLIEYLPGGE